ncbi:MAG: TIGR01906 family membrane protein [Mogibacterium sp.]|nr:TIGR01906 family membrane protein [Mogibacterium sp.]
MKRIHESATTHKTAAFICGLCLLLALLITSLQAVCYWIPDWWRNEYAKYDTPSNVRGEMSLDDAVHVTEDMLEYCIGRLDTLDDTEAAIDGVTVPFFTDREKAHLADCRDLFQKGIKARVIACLLLAAFVIYIYVHNGKQKTAVLLAKGYLWSLGFVAVLAAVIAVLCVIDFTHVFTVFHHIFFDNDLWILYPDKDNLINIMQEDVFSDAAMWIAGIWLAAAAVFAAASAVVIRKTSKQ